MFLVGRVRVCERIRVELVGKRGEGVVEGMVERNDLCIKPPSAGKGSSMLGEGLNHSFSKQKYLKSTLLVS